MTVYGTVDDLQRYALPATATQGVVDDSVLIAELETASASADSYFRGRYNLPLLAWDTDVTRHVCYIAAYNVMASRGFAPNAGADAVIERRYYESVGFPDRPGSGWFPAVQRQAIHPNVTESGSGGPAHPFPQVKSARPRGWGRC